MATSGISLYEISVPAFLRVLHNLENILKKGEEWAKAQGKSEKDLLEARIHPNMYALIYQIQRVSDSSKGAIGRISGVEAPKMEDNETTFAELYERIDKTVKYLESVDRSKIDGQEGKEVILMPGGNEYKFTALGFLTTFALPNMYFHTCAAYMILRGLGVEVGKMDYLGEAVRSRQ